MKTVANVNFAADLNVCFSNLSQGRPYNGQSFITWNKTYFRSFTGLELLLLSRNFKKSFSKTWLLLYLKAIFQKVKH